MPIEHIDSIHQVSLTSRPWTSPTGINAAGTANRYRTMMIYPLAFNDFIAAAGRGYGDEFAQKVVRHEFGHFVAYKLFQESTPPAEYIRAAETDPVRKVTDYGMTNWAEDFAEAMELYLRTHANGLSGQARRDYWGRFAFLDKIFGYRGPSSVATDERQKLKFYIHFLEDKSGFIILMPEWKMGIFLN